MFFNIFYIISYIIIKCRYSYILVTFLTCIVKMVYVLLRALSVYCLLSTDWYTRNRLHNPKS
jgi:uncharacterized membrane protein